MKNEVGKSNLHMYLDKRSSKSWVATKQEHNDVKVIAGTCGKQNGENRYGGEMRGRH